jgi:hypothetical protein
VKGASDGFRTNVRSRGDLGHRLTLLVTLGGIGDDLVGQLGGTACDPATLELHEDGGSADVELFDESSDG